MTSDANFVWMFGNFVQVAPNTHLPSGPAKMTDLAGKGKVRVDGQTWIPGSWVALTGLELIKLIWSWRSWSNVRVGWAASFRWYCTQICPEDRTLKPCRASSASTKAESSIIWFGDLRAYPDAAKSLQKTSLLRSKKALRTTTTGPTVAKHDRPKQSRRTDIRGDICINTLWQRHTLLWSIFSNDASEERSLPKAIVARTFWWEWRDRRIRVYWTQDQRILRWWMRDYYLHRGCLSRHHIIPKGALGAIGV
jgi:hypothetical protein